MAQQTIGVGSVAGDGTGDPLRAAFIKANANFAELYSTAFGVAQLAAALAALPTSAPAGGGPWLNNGVLTLASAAPAPSGAGVAPLVMTMIL